MDIETTEKLPYPKAVGFIVTNEFCERFSFYGLRSILSTYLGIKLGYGEDVGTVIFHVFTMFAYFFPLLGAMIADGWLGRFRTIFYLSLVYAMGTVLLSLTAIPSLNLSPINFTILALLLIAIGTGGIKPCVSAFGGDQFKMPEQERYLSYFFSMFYFSINAGSFISTYLTPMLKEKVKCFGGDDCYSLAFGVPAILMIISIIFFVIGRKWYIMKSPTGNVIGRVFTCIAHAVVNSIKSKEKREHWLDHADDKYAPDLIEDIKGLLRVLLLYIPLPVFWALFDQQGSRWTFQARRMDNNIGSWQLIPEQMQVLNPVLILIFIPLFEVAIYPFMIWCKLIRKPLHKMIWGGVLAAIAFVISGIVELQLLPTYGTPVSEGLAQLRVYNGFNCNFTMNLSNYSVDQNVTEVTIGPLTVYENLDIVSHGFVELPYILQGEALTECGNYTYNGNFHLLEKTANSYFINRDNVYIFTDKTEKEMGSVVIRFLSNLRTSREIRLEESKKNKTNLILQSNDFSEKVITSGSYDILVDGKVVQERFALKTGAVYTVNIYENVNGEIITNPVTITPPNTIHILWLIPQYLIMTMGEVMFSVTGLEFSFTQAPASMKSVLQSIWLLTVAFGNIIVVVIVEGNFLDAQWKEFFLFAGLMLVDMLIFAVMAFRYKYVENKSSTDDLADAIKLPLKSSSRASCKES